ncbi:hypothetical protein GFS24_27935 [Chitinophaga sp. SYP-B3965]|nr:hypothetical protein [Chitinophaga sp. SYP-B3965]
MALLCIAMITSCKKDPNPQLPTKLLLRVATADNIQMDKFMYNEKGQVIRSYYYRGYTGDTAYQDYTYLNNRLHKITHHNAEHTMYFYAGSNLVKTEVSDATNGVTSYLDHIYRNGKLDETHTYYKENGQWDLTQENTYDYDAHGNVHKINVYHGPDLQTTVEFTYHNDHLDPLPTIFKTPLVEKEIHYNGEGGIEWTTANTYEYDTKGYPVKRETITRNADNNVLSRHTFFYSYKD